MKSDLQMLLEQYAAFQKVYKHKHEQLRQLSSLGDDMLAAIDAERRLPPGTTCECGERAGAIEKRRCLNGETRTKYGCEQCQVVFVIVEKPKRRASED